MPLHTPNPQQGQGPKRLIVIVPELLPVPAVKGGAVEQWVHETTQRLDPKDYSISICSRPGDQASPAGIRNIHIPWTPVEKAFSALKDRVSWRNPLRYVAKIVCVSSYGRRAMQAAQSSDIVYIHNEPNILLFMRKQPGQRVVLHMHNDHLSARLFRPLYRRLLRQVDSVICVSDYIRRCALAHYPEFADKFVVLFNATAPEVFRPYGDEARAALGPTLTLPAGTPTILYVGRLVPEKGADVLIQAFAQLKAQHPRAKLVIAGSSFFAGAAHTPYQTRLIQLASPFKDDIVFTGYLPHTQLKYLYSTADVIAFPPVWGEPCALVVLEAMASGVCFVATDVGGIPEVMDDQTTGLLVPPGDSAALRRALDLALRSPERRRAWGQAARAKIEAGYTWQHLMGRLPTLLEGRA